MNAFDNITTALARESAVPQRAIADTFDGSKAAHLREILKANGPMRARELTAACGLRSSALVSALLRNDMRTGRVSYHEGEYSLNDEFTPPGPRIQRITWIAVGTNLPDADTTVLVATKGCAEPVWLGYYGDGEWFDTDAMRIEVTHWAPMPQSPNPSPL